MDASKFCAAYCLLYLIWNTVAKEAWRRLRCCWPYIKCDRSLMLPCNINWSRSAVCATLWVYWWDSTSVKWCAAGNSDKEFSWYIFQSSLLCAAAPDMAHGRLVSASCREVLLRTLLFDFSMLTKAYHADFRQFSLGWKSTGSFKQNARLKAF